MSWLEYDRTQERPDHAALARAWAELTLTPRIDVPAAIADYVRELKRLCSNGDARFAWFDVIANRDFDWFVTRNRFDDMEFCERLLQHPAVRAALPDVTAGASFDGIKFAWNDALTLDGELARALVRGGAYDKFAGTAAQARTLGERCCGALFQDRYAEVDVFVQCGPWSDWFFDIAWDCTWLILDRRLRRVALLVQTDTD